MPSLGELQFQQTAEDTLTVALAGSWKLTEQLPSADQVRQKLDGQPGINKIAFDTRQLAGWDSGLLIFLTQVNDLLTQKKIAVEAGGLPEGTRKMLALAAAVPEKKDARKAEGRVGFLAHLGSEVVDFFRSSGEILAFIGDTVVAFLRLLRGRAQYRKTDLWLVMAACGGQALPIVSLICFLVGLILAFIGAIQLQLFGAQIYVADLVGIAMVRLMAAIMTGIVMAGRTGGAFAAQLGTMQVNQEIDALKTLGISPMEFLVLPRMLALALMMPLLCLYANVMGILGGMVVGVGMLDIGLIQYYNDTYHTAKNLLEKIEDELNGLKIKSLDTNHYLGEVIRILNHASDFFTVGHVSMYFDRVGILLDGKGSGEKVDLQVLEVSLDDIFAGVV